MESAVFLDRDNTLIANDGDLGDPDAVQLLDGVAAGLAALREAGFRLIVITNQGGVARGRYNEDQVDAVHQEIACQVDLDAGRTGVIDRFYYCPYHPEGTVPAYRRDHPWRKPRPGMILQAASDMRLDLGRSWVIGDQVRDIEAGRAAGCRTVLINATAEQVQRAQPTAAVGSFAEAVRLILDDRKNDRSAKSNAGSRVDAAPASHSGSDTGLDPLKQAISDLSEDLRMERARRVAFTPMKLTAVVLQLIAVLLILLGLLSLGHTETFLKWAAGGVFVQLATIAVLLADGRT